VLLSDYSELDFVTLEAPPDANYEENYWSEVPSVHDLFDIVVDPMADPLTSETNYIVESHF
jgi:hypothetical protein